KDCEGFSHNHFEPTRSPLYTEPHNKGDRNVTSILRRHWCVCTDQLASLCCRQVQSNPTVNRKEVVRTKTGDDCPGSERTSLLRSTARGRPVQVTSEMLR